MSWVSRPGEAPGLAYAGRTMPVLAGSQADPLGFAAIEMTIPALFGGPIPHAHDGFDEAIYVLSGRLLVVGDGPEDAVEEGELFLAPRGQRHGFRSPDDAPVRVLGIWTPAEAGLALTA